MTPKQNFKKSEKKTTLKTDVAVIGEGGSYEKRSKN